MGRVTELLLLLELIMVNLAPLLWNSQVKLILSDVDETLADNYTAASPEMIHELISLLREGVVLFLVTGSGLPRVRQRIIDHIPPTLRHKIVVAHCSGAEVYGFAPDGKLREHPFYSLYDTHVTHKQKKLWREVMKQLLQEFTLKVFKPSPVKEFKAQAGDNPLAIIYEDRGPQITFEMINGYDLSSEQEKQLEISIPQTHGTYDLRIPILERAEQLFAQANLPITPRLGGMW